MILAYLASRFCFDLVDSVFVSLLGLFRGCIQLLDCFSLTADWFIDISWLADSSWLILSSDVDPMSKFLTMLIPLRLESQWSKTLCISSKDCLQGIRLTRKTWTSYRDLGRYSCLGRIQQVVPVWIMLVDWILLLVSTFAELYKGAQNVTIHIWQLAIQILKQRLYWSRFQPENFQLHWPYTSPWSSLH